MSLKILSKNLRALISNIIEVWDHVLLFVHAGLKPQPINSPHRFHQTTYENNIL